MRDQQLPVNKCVYLSVSRLLGPCVLFLSPHQPYSFSCCFDWCAAASRSPDYCPSHSLLLPSLIVPLCIYLVLSPLSFSPLFFILHAFFCCLFILTPPSPPPALFSSDTHTHTQSDAKTPSLTSQMSTLLSSCPHSSFLSGSVSASDSVTNGTASFSTAVIPQR